LGGVVTQFVLVVDDDKELRELLTEALVDEGYRAVATATIETALALCAAEDPALIVLDVYFPQMSGLEFLIRYRAAGGDGKVVLISGARLPQSSSLANAADAYLAKPFSLGRLLEVVADLITGARAETI
jgi:DNA-binding response OmpR family regulator